jgi:hypothetical protein
MLEIFVALTCACLVFLTPLTGAAISLCTEKWLGLWAYAIGWAVPVMLVGGAYALYDVYLRVTPCAPRDSLACGEPLPYAFAFVITWLGVIGVANFLAQVAVYVFAYGRRATRMLRQVQMGETATPQ